MQLEKEHLGAGRTLTCLSLDQSRDTWHLGTGSGGWCPHRCVVRLPTLLGAPPLLPCAGSPLTVRVVLASGMHYWRWSWPKELRVSGRAGQLAGWDESRKVFVRREGAHYNLPCGRIDQAHFSWSIKIGTTAQASESPHDIELGKAWLVLVDWLCSQAIAGLLSTDTQNLLSLFWETLPVYWEHGCPGAGS